MPFLGEKLYYLAGKKNGDSEIESDRGFQFFLGDRKKNGIFDGTIIQTSAAIEINFILFGRAENFTIPPKV